MLSNSTRSVPKVTIVPLLVDQKLSGLGRSLLKYNFVRQLSLRDGEVDMVLKPRHAVKKPKTSSASLAEILRKFEGTHPATELPTAAEFSQIPSEELIAFGRALVKSRQEAVKKLQQPKQTESVRALAAGLPDDLDALNGLVNTSTAATNAFLTNSAISPVGWMNLERMEMTPAGISQGELIATIPLAPKEQTTVVQQEWSVISQEFTSIVTDQLENYSMTGVTENSELAKATTSQNAHSNQFNVTASASGGCGFVSGSAATSFGSQDSGSTSATASTKHAVTTTKEASSRVKQSRKVTISTSTVSGSSNTTSRTLENPSETEAMRIDYFSMMRKWHVGLYRYGLRLTYDITVPEPGAAMRSDFRTLQQLQDQANAVFTFNEAYKDVTRDNYYNLAQQYGAQISDPPPPRYYNMQRGGQIQKLGTDGDGKIFVNQVPFTVKEGYAITGISLDLELSFPNQTRMFDILGCSTDTTLVNNPVAPVHFNLQARTGPNGAEEPFMLGLSDDQTITYMSSDFGNGSAVFTIFQELTDEAFEEWRTGVWNSLYDGAQTSYYTTQSKIQSRIADLQGRLNGVDTLTLRREENDEIMKCVLRWILGTDFEFMPQNVQDLFSESLAVVTPVLPGTVPPELTYGVNFTGNSLDPLDWSAMQKYQNTVNFINEAIEWENVVYFLYSYFWDVPPSWNFVRRIQHPDATRQAFLRAGSSRVVLTVRKGYESAWTWFAEHGDITLPDPIPDDPYMPIAAQIQHYDDTNYPGIPPANPSGGGSVVDDGSAQVGTTATQAIEPGETAITPVKIPVVSNKGFVVGATAVIGAWDSSYEDGNQESQTIVAVAKDGKSITVQGLLKSHDLKNGEFPVLQASSKGVLIAEWYEYTPSQGTMIAVNSDLNSIA